MSNPGGNIFISHPNRRDDVISSYWFRLGMICSKSDNSDPVRGLIKLKMSMYGTKTPFGGKRRA